MRLRISLFLSKVAKQGSSISRKESMLKHDFCKIIRTFNITKSKPSSNMKIALIPVVAFLPFWLTLSCHDESTSLKTKVTESNTGMTFSPEITFPPESSELGHQPFTSQKSTEMTLMALGARQISFLRFNVYAVGIYASSCTIEQIKNKLTLEKVKPSNRVSENMTNSEADWPSDTLVSELFHLPLHIAQYEYYLIIL